VVPFIPYVCISEGMDARITHRLLRRIYAVVYDEAACSYSLVLAGHEVSRDTRREAARAAPGCHRLYLRCLCSLPGTPRGKN
jgi:hypothetical protein